MVVQQTALHSSFLSLFSDCLGNHNLRPSNDSHTFLKIQLSSAERGRTSHIVYGYALLPGYVSRLSLLLITSVSL